MFWRKLGRNLLFAYCAVAITWIFVILFVALEVLLNMNKIDPYEKVDGVSALSFHNILR